MYYSREAVNIVKYTNDYKTRDGPRRNAYAFRDILSVSLFILSLLLKQARCTRG